MEIFESIILKVLLRGGGVNIGWRGGGSVGDIYDMGQ